MCIRDSQKTLEGAASGTGAVDGAEASSPASGAPAAEGDDAEAREEVDGRSVYVGNVSIYVAVPVVDLKGTLPATKGSRIESPTHSTLGRLFGNAGGDPTTLPGMWRY